MIWIVSKYFMTAGIIVLVSELAKRSDKLGAFVAAMPLITVLTLVWLSVEGQSNTKIANHAYYTFWYVVPTLPMFLIFPKLLPLTGFWQALLICIGVTAVIFLAFAMGLKRFGIELLP